MSIFVQLSQRTMAQTSILVVALACLLGRALAHRRQEELLPQGVLSAEEASHSLGPKDGDLVLVKAGSSAGAGARLLKGARLPTGVSQTIAMVNDAFEITDKYVLKDFKGEWLGGYPGDNTMGKYFTRAQMQKVSNVPAGWCDGQCKAGGVFPDCEKFAAFCAGCNFCSQDQPIRISCEQMETSEDAMNANLDLRDIIVEAPCSFDTCGQLGARILNFVDTNKQDRKKLIDAVRYAVQTLNSKPWAEKFLKKRLTERTPSMNSNPIPGGRDKQLSNEEILAYLHSGSNPYFPQENRLMEVHLTKEQMEEGTIGYTKNSTLQTWVNVDHLEGNDAAFISGNIAHEYMHNLGFNHDTYDRTSNWADAKTSVPYAVGDSVRPFAAEFARLEEQEKLVRRW